MEKKEAIKILKDFHDNLAVFSIRTALETLHPELKESEDSKKQGEQKVEEIDEEYKIGKWFTGLIPCWINAPSTLQPEHSNHGKNVVAVHLKGGGYRCCCVDDKKPITFSVAENTPFVEGWHNRESSV